MSQESYRKSPGRLTYRSSVSCWETFYQGLGLPQLETGVFAAISLAVGLVVYEPGWSSAYALLCNLLFFGLAMLTCIRCYLEGGARYVNTGIVFLALWLITRYADTFWPLLPQSVFFMTGGLVLLGVAGGLELLRRRLLSAMRLPATI